MRKDVLSCVECQKEVVPSTPYKMVALEKPYINLFFHRDCYNSVLLEIEGWENLPVYLARNLEVWYNKGVR